MYFLKDFNKKALIWSHGAPRAFAALLATNQYANFAVASFLQPGIQFGHTPTHDPYAKLWSSLPQSGPFPSSHGDPELRLVRFFEDSNKKIFLFELWSSLAQIGPFP